MTNLSTDVTEATFLMEILFQEPSTIENNHKEDN